MWAAVIAAALQTSAPLTAPFRPPVPPQQVALGVLLGLADGERYKTVWIARDSPDDSHVPATPQVLAVLPGLVVPQQTGFLTVDVVSARARCGAHGGDDDRRRDFIVVRPLGASSDVPDAVRAQSDPKRACAETGDASCREEDVLRLSFLNPQYLSYVWSGYSDCGAHPDGSAASGVVKLRSIGPLFTPNGEPDLSRAEQVELWSAVAPSARATIAAEARRASPDANDTCCCRYLPEVDPGNWRIAHTKGRWSAFPRLHADGGQYCSEGEFTSDVSVDRIARNPAARPAASSDGDWVCAPTRNPFCVFVASPGLATVDNATGVQTRLDTPFEATGSLSIVMAEWALGPNVRAWTETLTRSAIIPRHSAGETMTPH